MRFNLRHLLPLALLTMGCGVDSPCSPLVANATESQSLSYLRCLVDVDDVHVMSDFTREHVVDDVYHYSLRLQVGPDAKHDVIGLHRVVRERAAWQPVASANAVFFVHGDGWDFQGAFMASTLTGSVDTKHSAAVYMAREGADVWGIDQRWTQVPLQTQDFSFMKDWNLGTHAKDVGTGLAVARQVRQFTGSGNGQMKLLGWSRGAQVGYAYLNSETRLPASKRHVDGFIPVDMVFNFGPKNDAQATALKQAACVRAQVGQFALSQGRYEGNLSGPGAGMSIIAVGQGALGAPNVPAPAPLPPLTFRQLGVTLGSATYTFLTDVPNHIEPPVPFYHFVAGTFSAAGMPTGFKYLFNERQFFDFLVSANPFQDLRQQVEGDELLCGAVDLPYDDYLKDVKVPVLYVGAAGGFGKYGEFTVKNQLGSKDVTVQRVGFESDADRGKDFGHADLWLAKDAQRQVWEPIFKWVRKH